MENGQIIETTPNTEKLKLAFIDVQNTETTAQKWLGFSIDWQKLATFLEDEWGCNHIYFYLGIQHGDELRAQEFENLKRENVTVRPKYYFTHKVSDKIVNTTCNKCAQKITVKVNMGYSWKCNCDVELTADLLEHANENTAEIYLLSGDGDFEFLINKAISKGVFKVSIVSTSKSRLIAGKPDYRLSKKLKSMTKDKKEVRILELDNLKKKIESGSLITT